MSKECIKYKDLKEGMAIHDESPNYYRVITRIDPDRYFEYVLHYKKDGSVVSDTRSGNALPRFGNASERFMYYPRPGDVLQYNYKPDNLWVCEEGYGNESTWYCPNIGNRVPEYPGLVHYTYLGRKDDLHIPGLEKETPKEDCWGDCEPADGYIVEATTSGMRGEYRVIRTDGNGEFFVCGLESGHLFLRISEEDVKRHYRPVKYEVGQKLSGIKEGDSVRVTRRASSREFGWGSSWLPLMDNYVGKTFIVDRTPDSGSGIGFVDILPFLPYFVLEKIGSSDEKANSKSCNAYKVGDVVKYKKGDRSYVVDRVNSFEEVDIKIIGGSEKIYRCVKVKLLEIDSRNVTGREYETAYLGNPEFTSGLSEGIGPGFIVPERRKHSAPEYMILPSRSASRRQRDPHRPVKYKLIGQEN